jgi:ribosome-associated translation inhibitor RaiA
MKVDVRMHNADLADAVRIYATRRILFTLGRLASHIGRVRVRISDTNGVRGGVDQCCNIGVELLPSGKVVLEQVNADLFTAIDRAAERTGQVVRRKIQRRQNLRILRESVRMAFYPQQTFDEAEGP